MKKASEKISAVFQFNRYGLLTGIFLNSENEKDQTILIKGISQVLKPNRNLLKKIFRRYDGT
jgi:hypothetical protein